MRPLLKFHSNRSVIFSHSRDIQVYVYQNKLRYEIPIYFDVEHNYFNKKSYLIFDIIEPKNSLFPVESQENHAYVFQQMK